MLAHLKPLFVVVIKTFKLNSKWIPRKEEMVTRGNLGKMPKMSALGKNKYTLSITSYVNNTKT
jgi:hypothetical protein